MIAAAKTLRMSVRSELCRALAIGAVLAQISDFAACGIRRAVGIGVPPSENPNVWPSLALLELQAPLLIRRPRATMQRSCSPSTQNASVEWPVIVRSTEFKLGNYGGSNLLMSKGG